MTGQPIDHNRSIALAAKAALTPLGFRRRGQSRVWLADHRYWLLVVEFQPSAWSKGSYLNVAAHWLWHPPSQSEPRYHLNYDFSRRGFSRVGGFVDLAKPEQYGATSALAEEAAVEAGELRALLPSLEAAAAVLIAADAALEPDERPAWKTYDAAVAAAMTEMPGVAITMLESILATPNPHGWALHPAAQVLLPLARDPAKLRATVTDAIAARRKAFRLPAIVAPFA